MAGKAYSIFLFLIDTGMRLGEALSIKKLMIHNNNSNYIVNLPNRFNTMVGERGVSLSGGQRQRLSIARSILLKPKIIIFDDSTSAVDAATEQKIRIALKEATKSRTSIIISHRLSSLMHADEIIFLEFGKIQERGTHEELIASGGKYSELYELQIRPKVD